MSEASREQFDRIADRYHEAAESWNGLYEQIAVHVNPLLADKVVLDVGNGGHFAYDPAIARRVIALDISAEMVARIQLPGIAKVVGDARDLTGIDDASVDVIAFVFSLHHITGRNLQETFSTLDRVLASAQRKLRPGGTLVIAEPVLPGWLFRLQTWVFPASHALLERLRVGMIFFYSLRQLRERIAARVPCRRGEMRTFPLPVKGRIDPLGGSFPGRISIPSWLHPLRYRLITVPVAADFER